MRSLQQYLPSRRKHPMVARAGWGLMALLMLGTIFIDMFVWRDQGSSYILSAQAEALLPASEPNLAQSLVYDTQSQTIEYNKGYNPSTSSSGDAASAKFSATFHQDAAKGVTVTDPYSQVSVTLKPQFSARAAQKQDNRVIYPVTGRDAQQVYTAQAVKVKEDIILNSFQGDEVSFSYDLELSDGLEAQIEPNGAIGIYGTDSVLLGNVTTGSDADAALLEKARENAAKTNLLFSIPAPFIKESGKKISDAHTWYGLQDNVLTIYASGLTDATYPLSIDPSVYIETAAKLMRGNNESNIDFDIDNELIQKGRTTGGRFDSWASSLSLPSARWNHSTAVAGGFVYVVGGSDGSSTQGDLYWAHFNTSTGAIEATNPGSGACASWCTNTAYNLPSSQVRQGASLVAYNGYLYLFGGLDGSGTPTSTVYISKLGANGEPQLWHPTDSNKTNWVYWYSDTALSSNRSFLGAVAYNNRMYVVGGSTTGWTGGSTSVQKADINPIGTLSNWTTTGMSQLSSAIMSHSLQTYNDYLYVVGGISSTTTQSAVLYSKINTDGTINAWQTGNPIGNTGSTTPRAALGGKMGTVWGGFIYVAGGCSTVNASGYCTSIASDIQLASVNADGSITDWTTVSGVTNSRMGYGLVAWRNSLYGVGGCTAQNTTTGACTAVNTSSNYGEINPDGDVSTVSTSVPSGTSPCVASNYYNCDLPPQGDGNGQAGGMSGGAIINNGYVYYMGGCTAVGNNSVCYTGNSGKSTDNIAYAAIDSAGRITRVTSCAGSFAGSWCAINTGMGAKLAAFTYTVFNNTMYVIGGTSGTEWQDDVWRSTFNSDGTWGSWSSQTFAAVGLGSAKGYQYSFTRANPSSASTYPGNLYVLGGCSGVTASDNGLDCTGTLYTEVYKCWIKTDTSIETTGSACTTSGQLQIDSEPGTGGSQGLGVMAGTVYANYVYMIGGQSPGEAERGAIMYAKIDNSNNIVAADGGSIWITSPNEIDPVRRRGSAFGYNGYLYALAGFNVTEGGGLNDLLYAKINVSDGSIDTFTTSTVTVTARWDLRIVVNNGYVYAIGGCSVGTPPASCTTMTSSVQTFQLYNNYSGSPKTLTAGTVTNLTDRMGAGVAILDGYIYVAGGCTSTASDCATATTSVQSAAISAADGSIGTWSTSGVAALTAARAWGRLLAAGGTLYFVGGQTSGSTAGQSTVYYATPSSGAIGTWSTGTSLPAGRTRFGAAVWNDRLYILGGRDGSSNATSTVYVSSKQSGGGNITSWSSGSTGFNVARSGLTAVAYANNLYIFGGYTGTYYLNDSQFAAIGYKTGTLSQSGTTLTGSGTTWTSGMVGSTLQYADGATATVTGYTSATSLTVDVSRTLSAGTGYVIDDGLVRSWTYTTSLPLTFRDGSAFAANGFIYVTGGRTADTSCTPHMFAAPISANTTIATGNNPTGVGEWYETNVRYSGDRYGAGAVYNQGKVYMIGGACGTAPTYTGANRVIYGTLQSQPQIARYSRMIDTDSDVFPTKWLMNGLDNSTGARWYMRYRSSTAANAVWGQDTNFGEVSLGTPETYTPLDGGGSNTSYARYYYLIITIDSQQAYGYPEDVARGPTIADLSLFYTADPSKRLIHGKTFTGGEQQPLDTPF